MGVTSVEVSKLGDDIRWLIASIGVSAEVSEGRAHLPCLSTHALAAVNERRPIVLIATRYLHFYVIANCGKICY